VNLHEVIIEGHLQSTESRKLVKDFIWIYSNFDCNSQNLEYHRHHHRHVASHNIFGGQWNFIWGWRHLGQLHIIK